MSQKICKVRILDEVSCVLVGLHESHLEVVRRKYGVFSPNYFFSPLYKLGRWDGKINFVQKNGKTFVYLLEEILPMLMQFGYKFELEDLRKTAVASPRFVDSTSLLHIIHWEKLKPIELRHYQVSALNALIEHGNGIVVAGTGAGKTITCAALCMVYGECGIKTLTIVPDQGLIAQTKKQYINCELDTGEYSGNAKTLEHQHIVSTWQALQHNPKVVELFQMVIVDECHGAKAKSLQSILTDHAFNIPHRFGFTGTLPKEPSDLLTVHVAIGPVRYEIPASELIEEGVLARPNIDIIQLEEDLTKQYHEFCEEVSVGKPPTYIQFKDGYFPDYSSEKSYLYRKKDRIDWIADVLRIKGDQKKGNVLCLVDNIPYGRQIAARIPGAIFVNGQDMKKASKRQEVYDLFKDNDNLVVIGTVHIVGTGISIDRIFNLVLVDMGKSFIRTIQGIGRSLRKADDKDTVSITDICGDLKYSKKHLKTRTNYYDEAKYPYKKHKVNYNKNDVLKDI